ncbi:ABC transporter substrate-binding protein [Yinghuangia soli]|uniref:ABC transporter substrate-binding protein n=1 Tax=Yinghuangia soli TaxID=2908204 RepID=A0AA41Q6C1_9ACTN|nr:ABC transporter substrate-binding protein [Yinghuangia soli]MCF2531501.1 ABC transporter substrate-binding protein [Yinghuangia soli]
MPRFAVLAVAGALSAVLALSGCGGDSSGGAAAPGTLRVDSASEPQDLDPLAYNTSTQLRLTYALYDTLLENRGGGQVGPQLADLPVVSADGRTYTFKLRAGVKFHQGQDLTSADVKFTYETIMNPKDPKAGSIWRSTLAAVAGVAAPDPLTVVFTLKTPYEPMAANFAIIPILSASTPYEPRATYATTENGSGPFRLAKWDRGRQISLTRNDAYFQGAPKLDQVVIATVKDETTRITNLVNGTTQISADLPPAQVPQVKGKNGIVVGEPPSSAIQMFIYPDLKDGATADVHFRKAMALALNRQKIVDDVFRGTAVPVNTGLPQGAPAFDAAVGQKYGGAPRIDEAKAELAQSSYKGEELALALSPESYTKDAATIIQQSLQAVGIKVRLEVQEENVYFGKLLTNNFGDLLLTTLPTGNNPNHSGYGIYADKSTTNFNKVADPKMQQLLDAAVGTTDPAAAKAGWSAVQQYDTETAYVVPVVTRHYLEAVSGQVKGHTTAANGSLGNLLQVTVS